MFPESLVLIFVISLGLSVDTFAVSVTIGLTMKDIRFFQAFKVAIIFALFQAGMPFLGWIIGNGIKPYIEPVDHWIAFTLFSILAIKMIIEGLKKENASEMTLSIGTNISMAIATSIDAFVIGISLALIDLQVLISCFIIGMVTFLVAMTGIKFGKSLGAGLGKKAIFGGSVILFLIGIKILIDHLSE